MVNSNTVRKMIIFFSGAFLSQNLEIAGLKGMFGEGEKYSSIRTGTGVCGGFCMEVIRGDGGGVVRV